MTFAVLGGFKQQQNMAFSLSLFFFFFFSELCVHDFCGRGNICRTAEYHFRFFLLLFVVEEPVNVCLSGYFSWRHSAKKEEKSRLIARFIFLLLLPFTLSKQVFVFKFHFTA